MAGKRRPRRKKALPPVSLGGTVIEKHLPFPVVHYPNHYGAFFAFSKVEGGEVFLCECSRGSLENLIELNKLAPSGHNANPLREAPLDSWNVPDVLAQQGAKSGATVSSEDFNFRPNLCHRCAMTPPTRRYCHEMYGGQFMQSFGWYVRQAYFRLGIMANAWTYLDDVCPEDFKALLLDLREKLETYETEASKIDEIVYGPQPDDIDPVDAAYRAIIGNKKGQIYKRLRKESRLAERHLVNAVENIVRQEFGFKKVGEGWVSETQLYQIVRRLYSTEEIVRHHRPDWLEGLEIDIYIPRLNLGLEYQGQQHYHPIGAWGGEDALKAVQERDARKKRLCKQLGVTLVEIDYTEPLTHDHIARRLGFAS